MSGAGSKPTVRREKAVWALWLFFAVLVVFVVSGYSLGKDMAQRGNARDAAILTGEDA
ncbi:hypothetical protein [Alteriqipengyuania sp. 357]